jgi:hypothetical protein
MMHQSSLQLCFDILGWFGAFLFLLAYFLLIIKRWASTSILFHSLNALGGFCLGASAWYDTSYPAAAINIIWGVLAVYGMYSDHFR